MSVHGSPVEEPSRTRALLAALLSTLMWSSAGVLVKWTPGHPLSICALRGLVAVPLLLLFLRRPRFTGSFAQIGAAVAHCATMVGFVIAVRLTTAANATVLQYTAPIYVAILGPWLLQEKTTWQDWLVIGVVLGGLALFFLDRGCTCSSASLPALGRSPAAPSCSPPSRCGASWGPCGPGGTRCGCSPPARGRRAGLSSRHLLGLFADV